MPKAQTGYVSDTPPPCELGAPSKFSQWRPGQDKGFWGLVDQKKRFRIVSMPTGSGKSIMYVTAALATGKRTVILTATKGLQDQLVEDLSTVGLFDMRGQQNYPCEALMVGGEFEAMWMARWGTPSCDVGPCHSGIKCELKNAGCGYYDAYRAANEATLIVTNYAYWISINKWGEGLGEFDLLVLDEAHAAPGEVTKALTVEITEREMKALGTFPLKNSATLQQWRMWARANLTRVQREMESYHKFGGQSEDGKAEFRDESDIPNALEFRMWRRLSGKLSILSDSTDDWIVEIDSDNGHVKGCPVWVHDYAPRDLFCGVPQVALVSATVRPKTAQLLGIEEDNFEFADYPSTFPVENRPLIWIPTVRMSHKMTAEQLMFWVRRIDQIIQRRTDRKGIIHTVSYRRQQFLMENSRFKHLMIGNTGGTTKEIVRSFKESPAPALLVSPSVATGFDFIGDLARYQIVGKIPFPDSSGPIMKRQQENDPEYFAYIAAQDLVQMYGRVVRSAEDYAETFIIDDNVEWFIGKFEDFIPGWFMDAWDAPGNGRVEGVPDAPALEGGW